MTYTVALGVSLAAFRARLVLIWPLTNNARILGQGLDATQARHYNKRTQRRVYRKRRYGLVIGEKHQEHTPKQEA